MPDNSINPVLGIDLGTTFSAIARWDGRGPQIYRLRTGEIELQSVVYFDPKTEEFLVGALAYNKGLIHPENMAFGIKRFMDDAKHRIEIGGRTFTPIELSSKILASLYGNVVSMFPKNVFKGRGTVVTVPYYFMAHQLENTKDAAALANINCRKILQEPIAASLSYAWKCVQENPTREGEETILVFDLGGGTFDLTLFKLIQSKDTLRFEVLGTGGDDRLGGMDFDECLVNLLLEKSGLTEAVLKLKGNKKKEIEYRKAYQKVRKGAVDAKIQLSFTKETRASIPFVIPPDKHIDVTVTRDEFEACIKSYTEKVRDIMERLWAVANVRASSVDRVVKVGGSSIIPCMHTLLCDAIGEGKIYADNDPSLCVAEGAALYAAYLDDPEVFGREIEITTRNCHALGVKLSGDRFARIISANRKAPCKGEHVFTTDKDNVETLDIEVYQGASNDINGNSRVGILSVPGLPKRPAGGLDILVTFTLNNEQKLVVKANIYEADTNKELVERLATFTAT